MGKKEFAAAALDLEYETLVIYIMSISAVSFDSIPLIANIHLYRRPQIATLIIEKTPTKVSVKYNDFANIFSPNLVSKLLKHNKINNHTIELVDGQQPPNKPIYSLKPVELETLKAYIEINLANGFIRSF